MILSKILYRFQEFSLFIMQTVDIFCFKIVKKCKKNYLEQKTLHSLKIYDFISFHYSLCNFIVHSFIMQTGDICVKIIYKKKIIK